MRNSDLRDQEWFSRVADPTDQLAERFKFIVFDFLHRKIWSEELRFVPVMHFETGPGALHLALRIQVNPSHPIWHYHLAVLCCR